jgi:hypothetical protein
MTRKKIVCSWDVFDTLIARRCGAHDEIFEIMGVTLGKDFKARRLRAEAVARAFKSNISIEDIYDELQKLAGWSVEDRGRALELEISTEFANVIPITENLARVRDGDILVSDMYLPRDVILELLRRAGLSKEVDLFVSARGKSDGHIWKSIRQKYIIKKHTGDNPGSDFIRPWLRLIPAALTIASAETQWERMLRVNGAPELSRYVREMRLRIGALPKRKRDLQIAQIESNFPLLLLASASLVQWCRDEKISHALMCSRDCILWASLANRVARSAGSNLLVEYFLISRVAALRPSTDYLAYARSRIKADSVVVDLSMTGVSLAALADRLGLVEVRAFVIALHREFSRTLYAGRFQSRAAVKFEYLMGEVTHQDLEALNQSLTPSVHDVKEELGGLSVRYAKENRSSEFLEAVKVQNDTFSAMLDRLPDIVIEEALAFARSTRFLFLVRECERRIEKYDSVVLRAKPGSALWSDPNGIVLGLPYASGNIASRVIVSVAKYFIRPWVREGAFFHAYAGIPRLVVRKLRRK